MYIEVLLAQLLVLAFTGAVWWLARRDLASRPAPPTPAAQADARELEQLCVMLEAMVTELTARMEAVEQRLQDVGAPLAAPSLPSSDAAPSSGIVTVPVAAPAPAPVLAPMPSLGTSSLLAMPPAPVLTGAAILTGAATKPALPQEAAEPEIAEPEIAAHAPLYALLEAGITDPAEITRRTGLGRGEVDLILSLRARHTL